MIDHTVSSFNGIHNNDTNNISMIQMASSPAVLVNDDANASADAVVMNTTSSATIDSIHATHFLEAQCAEIEAVLLSQGYSVVLHINMVLLASTLVACAVLVRKYVKQRVAVHGNLLLLFANVILLHFIHNLAYFACFFRYRLLLFTYTDHCQLLTPFWLVVLLYGPSCIYLIAYPALHFCVMVERMRATWLAEKYEQEGKRVGIYMMVAIWTVSLGFAAYVVAIDLADPEVSGHAQGVTVLTSSGNATTIFCVSILSMLLVLVTALCDWRLTVLNRRVRALSKNFRTSTGYSLSRNYQLNENVLAMRLILPLDISYALLYSIYNALVILIRAYKSVLSTQQYDFYYDLANMLLFLHSAVTIVVYIRFINFIKASQRRSVHRKPMVEHSRIYFNQLAAQWG